jgi:hypothetical protein
MFSELFVLLLVHSFHVVGLKVNSGLETEQKHRQIGSLPNNTTLREWL